MGFYTLSGLTDCDARLTNVAGDPLEPPQGLLGVPGPTLRRTVVQIRTCAMQFAN